MNNNDELFLLSGAAKLLGVKKHQLAYAVSSEHISRPNLILGNRYVFTLADIESARRYFQNNTTAKWENKHE